MADRIYEHLREYVFGLEIFDTHEHLPAFERLRPRQDVLAEYLTHYFSCDLVSAGLPLGAFRAAVAQDRPLLERWELVESAWQAARNTGYGRSLDIAARDLYGLGPISRKTLGPLNEAFVAARDQAGNFRRVLRERCRIGRSVLDNIRGFGDIDCDRELFAPALRVDRLVTLSSAADLERLAEETRLPAIHRLEDLEAACQRVIDGAVEAGIACLKSALAYQRPLRYAKVAPAAAQEDFAALFSAEALTAGRRSRRLEDYLMHHVCRAADRHGLTFEIHTGLQEGNGNYIAHAEPSQLTNLFMEYRNVRFDLFHIGYPFQGVLSALAKNFANVHIDFAWAHIISPAAAVAALEDYLDAVPANKISAFGGDYCFVDGVYGHQFLARENVARALARRVAAGAADLDEARDLARRILRDNPARLFNLAPETA